MQSPKFPFIQKGLGAIFGEKRLQQVWTKTVRKQIKSQASLDLIEHKDFDHEIEKQTKKIESEIFNASYTSRPIKHFLIEKSRGLCRQMTLIDPVDLIVLEALSQRMSSDIERSSPSEGTFFKPDDGKFRTSQELVETEYGSSFASWKEFQSATFGFSRENKFIVVSDVANFYDFIDFRHLRNIISSIVDVEEAVLDLLIFVLNNLSWRPDFMPPSEVGMPQINATAPRVMANAMLFEVDKVAESISIKNYARFMDDIDLGVDTIAEAKNAIKNIDLTLQSRKLRLNSSKTKILSQPEAFDHFCIDENEILQRTEELIRVLKTLGFPLDFVRCELERLYEEWWIRDVEGAPNPSSRFRRGNGSKILKWCLGLLKKTGGVIPQDDLIWMIRNDPGLRSTAFFYLSSSPSIHLANRKVARILKSGYFIDDQSLIDYSNFLLRSKFTKTSKFHNELRDSLDLISKNDNFGAICVINIISKYGTIDEIIEYTNKVKMRASTDNWLARSIAGCTPRFFGSSKKLSKFQDLVLEIDNEEANSVFNFHLNMASDQKFPKKHLPYLRQPNPSLPQSIYYPKVLMCLSLKNNPHYQKEYSMILSKHPSLTSDPFHKSMGF